MDPRAFYADLTANLEDLLQDRIAWEDFSVRNRQIWARIERAADAIKDAVLTLLRADLPTVW